MSPYLKEWRPLGHDSPGSHGHNGNWQTGERWRGQSRSGSYGSLRRGGHSPPCRHPPPPPGNTTACHCLGPPLCRILKCDYRLPGNRWELDNAYFIASCRNVLSNRLNCHSRCHGKLSLFAFSWLFKCFIAEFLRH